MSALEESNTTINGILNKSFFWQRVSSTPLSERQVAMLNMFLDGYEAKITSKTWSSLSKCSKDTAIRDIQDLVSKNILSEDIPGAKRPSYSIVYDTEDITQYFSDISLEYKEGTYQLKCIYRGMAAGPASYGMTDTLGRMHSDAQFAGSSSVPAHVEMMGFLGIGNNPMVGATVAIAVDIAGALSK
mgnify:CR=1 FL=1